jgi:serine phosphatase RsbU (regulator of sigma subunit)
VRLDEENEDTNTGTSLDQQRIRFLRQADYIQEVSPGTFRPAARTYEEMPYLQRLAALNEHDPSGADSLAQLRGLSASDATNAIIALSNSFRSLPSPEASVIAACGVSAFAQTFPMEGRFGGDFYDITRIDSHSVGFLIGDASGKGLAGALNMLPMLTAFRIYSKESKSPAHVLEKMSESAREMGVMGTALYFVVTKQEQRWLLWGTSAGAPPVMIFRADGQSRLFPEDANANMGVLGMPVNYLSGQNSIVLGKGDVLLACTDGISDAMPAASIGAIQSTVLSVLTAHADTDPKGIVTAVERRVREGAKGSLEDDATLICIRIG